MEAKTELYRIEVNADGSVGALLKKQVWNGEVIISEGNHRLLIPAESDADEIIAANSAHLQAMGFPAISEEDAARIKAARGV